jgi:hypothetical protein
MPKDSISLRINQPWIENSNMKTVGTVVLLAAALLAGCAESSTHHANRISALLMESGFHALAANTPTRKEKLSEMTPLRVIAGTHKGKPAYWMADPYVC